MDKESNLALSGANDNKPEITKNPLSHYTRLKLLGEYAHLSKIDKIRKEFKRRDQEDIDIALTIQQEFGTDSEDEQVSLEDFGHM